MMMGNYLSSNHPSTYNNADSIRSTQSSTNSSNTKTETIDANNNNNNNNNSKSLINTPTKQTPSYSRSSSDSLKPSPSPSPSPAPTISNTLPSIDQPLYDYDELYRASTIYPHRLFPHQTSVPLSHPIIVNGHCMYTDLIHTHPRILAIHNFLSAEECDKIVQSAEPRLKRSGVGMMVDQSSGMEQSSISARRTSSTAGFARQENHLIALIEARLMALVACPLEHIEPLQVVSYSPGQFYKAHYDTKPADHLNSYDGGLRLHTILVYLTEHDNDDLHLFDNSSNNNNANNNNVNNNKNSGGMKPTIPPSSSIPTKSISRSPSPPPSLYDGRFRAPSGCTFFPKLGLRVRPTKGMAIWWRNVLPNNKDLLSSASTTAACGYTVDTRTLHAGEPPISGKKYAINCWIREKPFVVSINNATAVPSPAPIPIIQVINNNNNNNNNKNTNNNNNNGNNTEGKNNGPNKGNQSMNNSGNDRRLSVDLNLIDEMQLHHHTHDKPASSHY